MLRKTPTGTWMPAWVPESTFTLSILLLVCSVVQSTVRNPPCPRALNTRTDSSPDRWL